MLKPETLNPIGHGHRPAGGATPFRPSLRAWLAAAGLALCAGVGAADAPFATGITEPFRDVTLSAPAPGIVTARLAAEGASVKEGTVILALDKKLEELELERRLLVRDQKQSDYDGTKKLFTTTKGVSKEDLDKKEADYKVAKVEHEMAAEQLRRREVKAPFSGTITKWSIDVGEACQPLQTLVRLVDTRSCFLIVNLEASSAARLTVGQTVKLEIASGSGAVAASGTIESRSPVVDPASGLQRIKVHFDNPDGKIAPGVAGRMFLE